MEASVIICSHNPRADYLQATLKSLLKQTLSKKRWELILIDNNSSPPVCDQVPKNTGLKITVIVETKLGLTNARLRGIKISQGALIILVDDDNILEKNYLMEAIKVAKRRKNWGVWSGSAIGRYQSSPDPFWKKFERYLCVRKIHQEQESQSLFDWEAMPHGAGLVIRRKVADLYFRLCKKDPARLKLDRAGSRLVSGGDNDIALCSYRAGFKYGVTPKLTLFHLIPSERVLPSYLLRLIRGSAFSNHLLTEIYSGKKSRVPWIRQTLGLLKRFNVTEPREALVEAYRTWGNLQYACKSR